MEVTINDIQFQKSLSEVIAKLLPDAIERGLTEACLLIEREAKQNCQNTAKDNGQLSQSITHEVNNTQGVIGTNVEYAPYVHEGTGIYAANSHAEEIPWVYKSADGKYHTTSGQKPKPFLKDAVEANRDNVLKCFENKLEG